MYESGGRGPLYQNGIIKMLSIIIPAYNEKQNIERTAETISGILVGKEIPYELVFISDGSTDGTYGEIGRAHV